jgi:hypothetical protein
VEKLKRIFTNFEEVETAGRRQTTNKATREDVATTRR